MTLDPITDSQPRSLSLGSPSHGAAEFGLQFLEVEVCWEPPALRCHRG